MAYKNKTASEYHKEWWQKNKKKRYEIRKLWIEKNPERWRASQLVNAYRQSDKKNDRGDCTLTIDWIIDNIFPKHCVHCGKTGWNIMGCNRLDNDKPHTPDNVEPCCWECNNKLFRESLNRDKKGRFLKNGKNKN